MKTITGQNNHLSGKPELHSKDGLESGIKTKTRRSKHYLLIAVIGLFALVLFQNIETTTVDFLFWSFATPKFVNFLVMLLIGFVAGYGFHMKVVHSKRAGKPHHD